MKCNTELSLQWLLMFITVWISLRTSYLIQRRQCFFPLCPLLLLLFITYFSPLSFLNIRQDKGWKFQLSTDCEASPNLVKENVLGSHLGYLGLVPPLSLAHILLKLLKISYPLLNSLQNTEKWCKHNGWATEAEWLSRFITTLSLHPWFGCHLVYICRSILSLLVWNL